MARRRRPPTAISPEEPEETPSAADLDVLATKVAEILSDSRTGPGRRFMDALYQYLINGVWDNLFENAGGKQLADHLLETHDNEFFQEGASRLQRSYWFVQEIANVVDEHMKSDQS